jgi:hypothetical protein
MCCLGRKRTPKWIQWHGKTIFYTTTVIHKCCSKIAEWLMYVVHMSAAFCFFVSKDNITSRTKHLLPKNHHEMANWPLQRCFENFPFKGDRVIALF